VPQVLEFAEAELLDHPAHTGEGCGQNPRKSMDGVCIFPRLTARCCCNGFNVRRCVWLTQC
jgi:hypothetical protein